MNLKHWSLCLLLMAGLLPFQTGQAQTLDEIWKGKFSDAEGILQAYDKGKAAAPSRKSAEAVQNKCFLVYQSGEYLVWTHGRKEDYGRLVEAIPEIDLENPHVLAFMEKHDGATLVDHIFMFKALKRGEDIESARDGISFTTLFPNLKTPNHNDYEKLKAVFSGRNDRLQQTYLEKLKFVFQNQGYTEGLQDLHPLIEKKVKDSPLKKEILNLCETYSPLCKGRLAPAAGFKDAQGRKYSFSDFKGKVIVVDVWATWCCSCLENMPHFQALREEYRDNDGVVFLTVSIDQPKAYAKWEKALAENRMSGTLNLLPDRESPVHFESAYHIVGVPRYLVIDRKGRNVNLYAPSPGKEMKAILENTLKH